MDYLMDSEQYYNRSALVELVCDKEEVLGRFEYVVEYPLRTYNFRLYTQCACPGRCDPPPQGVCVGQDSCTCEMSDGSGTVNLHALDNPTDPMKDALSPTNTILYNPCSPMTNPDCKDNSLCEETGSSLIPIGQANNTYFETGINGSLRLNYLSSDNVTSTINLLCDTNQREKPFFRTGKNKNSYDVFSVCACFGGCISPPSTPSFHLIDLCTFKSVTNGAVIDLHDLDDPYTPLSTTNTSGYTYYYNPCSGLQMDGCAGAAACVRDPIDKLYLRLGKPDTVSIRYNTTTEYFILHYTGGDGGHSFEVSIICDGKNEKPVLILDKEQPPYCFILVTKFACTF
ncbi:cation-independent mannose-6-phosphate receptor-like [Dysidea avara]|uniref:cation-independent mannose-6-phosphate receptor-like n=1 Tax=Dysidea avara TaxID=196820 RepID=UPI00332B00D5